MRFVTVVLIIVAVGLACTGQTKASRPAQSSPSGPTNAVPTGVWGGEGIRMEVTDAGADIEFNCARGSISQRLALDAQGHFQLRGTYKAETPAPASDGSVSNGSGATAIYTGALSGSSLHLEVSIEGQGTPRTFDLVQGDQGHLAKCA